MADSLKDIEEELARFIAALRELAPDKEFGGISLADLEAHETTRRAKDRTVEQDQAKLEASQDDRQIFYKTVAATLEKFKNGVIGDPDFGPDSLLYGAMGFVRKSERASGLTRKDKDKDKNDEK